jgi:mRNA interferase RelE/StbE
VGGYEIRITDAAAKELDALPRRKDRQAVVRRILKLAEDPRPPGCVKLSGREELYRVRQGPYRIVYSIEDDRLLVVVIRVARLPRQQHDRWAPTRTRWRRGSRW